MKTVYLEPYIIMDKTIIKFDDTQIEEYLFHQHKNALSMNNVDINKIIISNKFPFGKQDFEYLSGL